MVRKEVPTKVNEKISSEIALSQVELAKKIEKMKEMLENIFSLYSNCVIHQFSHKKPTKE